MEKKKLRENEQVGKIKVLQVGGVKWEKSKKEKKKEEINKGKRQL